MWLEFGRGDRKKFVCARMCRYIWVTCVSCVSVQWCAGESYPNLKSDMKTDVWTRSKITFFVPAERPNCWHRPFFKQLLLNDGDLLQVVSQPSSGQNGRAQVAANPPWFLGGNSPWSRAKARPWGGILAWQRNVRERKKPQMHEGSNQVS